MQESKMTSFLRPEYEDPWFMFMPVIQTAETREALQAIVLITRNQSFVGLSC